MVLELIEVRLGTRVGLRKDIAAPTEGDCPDTRFVGTLVSAHDTILMESCLRI